MKSVLTKRWASRDYNLMLRAPAASTRWCNSRPCSLLTFFSSPLEKESRQAQITTKQRRQPIREVRHYPGTSCGAAAGEWCLSDRGGPGKEGVKAHLESGTEQMSKGGKSIAHVLLMCCHDLWLPFIHSLSPGLDQFCLSESIIFDSTSADVTYPWGTSLPLSPKSAIC